MDLSVIILLIVCLANLSLGFFVLARNPKSRVTRSFFCISFFISAWAVCNYLTDNATSLELNSLFNRLAYPFGFLAIVSSAVFSHNFTGEKRRISKIKLVIPTVAITAFSMTNYVVGSVSKDQEGLIFSVGPFIYAYIAAIVILILSIAYDFHRILKSGDLIKKNQARIIVASLVVSIVIGTLLNAVIPAFSDSFNTAKYGPSILSLFLVSTISYAIVKHKLFDIRLIVARSMAYITSLMVLASLYGFIVFGVGDLLFDLHLSVGVQIFLAAATAIASLSFNKIKTFFDRGTNRLFYREQYDSQEVLDRVGKIVVEEFELYKILSSTRHILAQTLKSSFIDYIVIKNGKPHFENHAHKHISQPALILGGSLIHQRRDLLDVDDMDSESSLKQLFKNADVFLSLRLKTKDQVVGYVIFGAKKSGDIYSNQDKKLLLILASELAIAVQNALRFEEIQNFNLTLQAKVDEATNKLRRANEKLRDLDETKDDFISMASHQLRTPLTSVKGYISMIMEGDAGKITHTQQEMLGQAFFSSQRMVYLIADLLNVSRLKTGKFIIEPTPVSLATVVKEELEQLQETAAARDLTLTYDKPKDFPLLMLDEVKIRQVIMNFVDNAIYYTPNGGHIEVKLIDKPSTIELQVTDDGIGVPKSEQPHLFTKFYRAGNARKARPDGTGLGLFMAKKVVVAQGGSITFEAKEGKGSTFGFMFSKNKLAVPKSAKAATPEETAKEPVKTS